MTTKNHLSLLLFCLALLTGCDSKTVFKDNYDFEKAEWTIKNTPSFRFQIEDPSVRYNVFYNLRNNTPYKFHNLYVKYSLLDEKGKLLKEELLNSMLFDPTSGKPLGDGSGSILDHQFEIKSLQNYHFAKGKYTLKIAQYMRENPLTDVVSVGFTVEKNVIQ